MRRPAIGAFEATAIGANKPVTSSVTATSTQVKRRRYQTVIPSFRDRTSMMPVEIGTKTFQFETSLKAVPPN